MKLSYTKSYHITFSVEAHFDEEGGMGSESFVCGIETLEEAIQMLELAMFRKNDREWIIVCVPEVAAK